MTVAVVAGALANKPGNGGNAWSRLSWVEGLRRAGFDVVFLEMIDRAACGEGAVEWFDAVTCAHGFAGWSALVGDDGVPVTGMEESDLRDAVAQAQLLIDIGGHVRLRRFFDPPKRTVLFDDDPGFTQVWAARGELGVDLARYDLRFTVGLSIGTASCTVPTMGLEWRPLPPPVVLEQWVPVATPTFDRFTTVGTWRGPYGPLDLSGSRLGAKVHEFRKLRPLPDLTGLPFEAALAFDREDDADRSALLADGWSLVEPGDVASSPGGFRDYVTGSGAECSAAQGVYVGTQCGWFSDRTVRYLAAGRPAVVQDTGWSRHIPTGEGVVGFRDVGQAASATLDVVSDYDAHCRAAQELAREYFDAERVVSQVLEAAGVAP